MKQAFARIRPASHGQRASILAAIALVVVGVALWPSGASASKTQWSIFEDHPYLVRTDPATRERTLDELVELGADTLRIEVKWDEVAPNPGSRNRPLFDATNPAE